MVLLYPALFGSQRVLRALLLVSIFGRGLRRPGCVACTKAGAIWVSHALPAGGGGVARLDADGTPQLIVATSGAPADFMPNGWSMAPDGSFLIANLGDSGGAWRLYPDGSCTPVLQQGRVMETGTHAELVALGKLVQRTGRQL